MAEEIQLCKADGQEWGFRVTGGADFGTALTIIKIHKGSTSERAGLRVGDMIIKVNDQPLGQMTHFQATAAIAKAGNMCTATVIRGSLVEVPQIPIPVPQIVLQNGTEDSAPATTGVTGEQEELVLPSVLANMINTGIQEQPVDEEAALNQQNQEVDQEVADSWNFNLPQQLVVTLKSVTPTRLEGGRPGSPWEIIEERSTFIERPDVELSKEAPAEAAPAGQQKTGVAGQAIRAEVIKTGQASSVAAGEALRAEVIKAGQQKAAAAAGQAQPAADRTAAGEQQQSDAAQNKTEGGGSEEEAKEHKEYTEEEIAEMMSGCSEVLVGKCIGVDFQKLPPDTDIMKSEVLHVLIEEKIHKPEKKLTTFQQRPSRPKPRPKGEPEVRPAPYLPLKYKGTPKKKEEEPARDVSAELSGSHEATVGSEGVVEISQDATEVTEEMMEGEQTEEHKEIEEEMTEHENAESAENVDKPENQPENQDPITAVDPTDIESQLAEIQTQLAAIIQLPVEIQQHLTFIQTQLSKILELRAAAEAAENPDSIESIRNNIASTRIRRKPNLLLESCTEQEDSDEPGIDEAITKPPKIMAVQKGSLPAEADLRRRISSSIQKLKQSTSATVSHPTDQATSAVLPTPTGDREGILLKKIKTLQEEIKEKDKKIKELEAQQPEKILLESLTTMKNEILTGVSEMIKSSSPKPGGSLLEISPDTSIVQQHTPTISTVFATNLYPEIGLKRDDQIHIGRDVWVPVSSYEHVLRVAGTNRPQKFVKELAVVVYGYKTLTESSVMGRQNPHNLEEAAKPYLNKTKLDAITDCFISWLRASGTDTSMIPITAKKIPKYICEKIQDLKKGNKKRKRTSGDGAENEGGVAMVEGDVGVHESDTIAVVDSDTVQNEGGAAGNKGDEVINEGGAELTDGNDVEKDVEDGVNEVTTVEPF